MTTIYNKNIAIRVFFGCDSTLEQLNMKFVISVILLTGLATLIQSSNVQEKGKALRKRYEQIKTVCSEKNNFTEQELQQYEKQMSPESRKDKCMLACILDEAGIMQDGRFSKSGADEITSYLYDDDAELANKAKEVSKRCEKKLEEDKLTDECDIAQEIFLCVRKTAKQIGLKD